MSQFYCREDELRKLNKRYAGDKFECIVIYGRRRVGKTALINEFCKDKPTIFFSALNTTGKENLEALSKSIMSFERPDMESAPEFRSYDAALDELTALSKEKRIVFIHDGARPFLTEDMIERVYKETLDHGACVVGMPVKDTIKIADENGFIRETPKRSLVWQIQTPQVFDAELIVPAYRQVIEREQELLDKGVQITDDAMVVETMCAHPVKLVQGSYENMKLTTPEDLKVAEAFLDR